jgi:hypothetical protein
METDSVSETPYFLTYLEFLAMDKVHKSSDSKYKEILWEEIAGAAFGSNRKVNETTYWGTVCTLHRLLCEQIKEDDICGTR